MKKLLPCLAALAISVTHLAAAEQSPSEVKPAILQLAEKFVSNNDLPSANFNSNNIAKCDVQFFQDGRKGYIGNLKLKSGYSFTIYSDGTNAEVGWFHDGNTKTYYALEDVPKDKIASIKALNLRNKLNDAKALELAGKFFRLHGHEEENFQSPVLRQSYWSGGEDGKGGVLPYYEVTWHRKDVKKEDLEAGIAKLPTVVIEVSGIDSHLISYTKAFMPIGKDF